MWPFRKFKSHDQSDPEQALRHRIVRLDGEITEATSQVAIAQLLFLQHKDDEVPVTLRIESPGGSLTAGMAVVDTVRELRPPVRTRSPAVAHGAAAILLASGRKGERVIGPTAELSLTPLENPTGARVDLVRLRRQIAKILAELSGQAPEAVAQDLLRGRCFTPSEAVSYGLADRIEE